MDSIKTYESFINEVDMNDPILVALRDSKMEREKIRKLTKNA